MSDEVLEDVSQQKKQSARKNLQKKFHKHREQRNSVESDDTEVEDPNLYDSQDDNEDDSEHLADLMAASTTIKSVQCLTLKITFQCGGFLRVHWNH